MKLSLAVQKVLDRFEENQFECYLVGGCVRDHLLERPVHDIDLATNATPDQVEKIFKHTIPTGKKYGTITIIVDDETFEVTTYRKDLNYQNQRRPSAINFSKTIEEDLERRDFTINAIAYHPKKGFIDPYGGREDIRKGILKCVGDANQRFLEDSLRLLRGIRFCLKYQLVMEKETENSYKGKLPQILNLSKERVRDELLKIMAISIKTLKEFHQLDQFLFLIIPGFEELENEEQNTPYHEKNVLEHTYFSMIHCEDPLIKVALLFHDIGKPSCKTVDDKGIVHYYGHADTSALMARKILRELKFSNKEIESITELIKYHQSLPQKISKKSVRKLLNKLRNDEERIEQFFQFIKADQAREIETEWSINKKQQIHQLIEITKELQETNAMIDIKKLAIDGRDLLELGYQGQEIGDLLRDLVSMVLEEKVRNDRFDLICIAKQRKSS